MRTVLTLEEYYELVGDEDAIMRRVVSDPSRGPSGYKKDHTASGTLPYDVDGGYVDGRLPNLD